ncbi:MAG: ISNCY family transposase [Acidobacteriota bacterium]
MKRKELITLSREEHDRLLIVRKVMKREMSQVEAADLLNISDRQVRTLIDKVREKGAKGLAHGNRGRESPRKMAEAEEGRIVGILKDKYWDFGPTFAAEKLWERDGIRVSDEKLRQIMIGAGIWRVRRRRGEIHQWRERKHFAGELVQLDGSHHAWLEDRGPKLVLMGYIDDATNTSFGYFYDSEGLQPAMESLEAYIRRYGVPRAIYLDKLSTYKAVRQATLEELLRGEEAQTQFERAAKEVGINVIHADSPQAKGRIEREFGTLQDRLVKELRLAGVCTKDEANRFLEDYWPIHNQRFARPAKRPDDLHRPLPKGLDLRDIFCLKGSRTINDGYMVRWKGRLLVISSPSIAMRRRQTQVLERFDGTLTIRFNGRSLEYREVRDIKPGPRPSAAPEKATVKPNKAHKPAPNHPWRRWEPQLHHNSYLERACR